MADSDSLLSSPPALAPSEEQKVQAILNLVHEELGGLPYNQQIKVLRHVIEDLYGARLAAIEAEKINPQENSRLKHRLKHLQKLFEEHQDRQRAPGRSLLTDVKAAIRKAVRKDEPEPPPSRER